MLALVLLLAACGDSDTDGDDEAVAQPIDSSEVRDDVDCSPEVLGETSETPMVVAHYVIDGVLGAVCLGEEDETLLRAFEELAVITPPGQLGDIALFAGFTWEGGDDEATLAYVTAADDEGSQFVMAVGLDSYDEDPDEARLTMAHEFAHIFTATLPELDRWASPDECSTYWNGEGCFAEGSVMNNWVREFWPPEVLSQIDPNAAEVDTADGEERCFLDEGFFGPYAATTPEEDFAEAFSAFVYELEANTDGQQARLDWIAARPGLAEFRERAVAAGLTPLANNFEVCG